MTNVYHTIFTKKDGSDRSIRYIAMDDLHPDFKEQEITGTGTKRTGPRHVACWDVEANAFRTVNLDTIKQTPAVCGHADLSRSANGELTYVFHAQCEPPCTN